MPTFKRHVKLFDVFRTFLGILCMFYENLFSVQSNLALRRLFHLLAILVQVWMPDLWKSKTSTTCGAAPFVCYFSLRQQIWSRCTGWHRPENLLLAIPIPSFTPRISALFFASGLVEKSRATIATCLKWESPSIFFSHSPFSFIRGKRLCINVSKFMTARSLISSPFGSEESERHPTILLVGPSLLQNDN